MSVQVLLFNTYDSLDLLHETTSKTKRIPLSVAYLSGYLKKYGVKTKIVDLNLLANDVGTISPEQDIDDAVDNIIKQCNPMLIGLTCLFSKNFPTVINLSNSIKKYSGSIPIAIGGLHPTIFAKDILENCPSIDYIILGEGEKQLLALTKCLTNDKDNISEIDGIAYRKERDIIVNQKTKYIEDLDELPIPDYEALELQNYKLDTTNWYNPKRMPISVVVPLLTSRSCPN